MDIRIQLDIDQKTDQRIPLKMRLVDENDKEVPFYSEKRSTEPVKQPYLVESGQGTVYLDQGGKFTAYFAWTASDDKEREFPEEFEIEEPPTCPSCEKRVPGLSDYICDDCRYGC